LSYQLFFLYDDRIQAKEASYFYYCLVSYDVFVQNTIQLIKKIVFINPDFI